jgi:hypothetical protein
VHSRVARSDEFDVRNTAACSSLTEAWYESWWADLLVSKNLDSFCLFRLLVVKSIKPIVALGN